MTCPECHFENPESAHYCGSCATTLPPYKDIHSSPTINHRTTLKELTRGTVVAGRYETIERLGGGMTGKVYRVFDRKIEEEVALKLIKPEITTEGKNIERFSNGLKLARKVSHKNICRMFDMGEERGTHYITMEYIPGEDLKSIIRMTKQLSAGQVVSIAKQVCEGLREAHRLGIVHYDLKPQNIMMDRYGNAHIMDFGISPPLETKEIKGRGIMIGTPEYMSPEQVEGKEADQRSDVYSLGVILYEMGTGKLPFDGDSSLSIALKHKTELPPEPRKLNAQIPLDLNRLILKCLEKEREKRFQSVEELLSELNKIEEGITGTEIVIPEREPITTKFKKDISSKRWMIGVAFFIMVLVAGIYILYSRNKKPVLAPINNNTMLVVLPFENMGPPEDEYFADGITEEITSRLASLNGLSLISRTSAFKYKNSNKIIKQVGKELDVDYVLEGAVRWDRSTEGKGRVRVTSQLVRVSDDTHIWSERYDRVIEDIFSVQSEVAEQVARQLDLSLLEPERNALNARPTDNLEAYDYYLRGNEYENKGWLYNDAREFEKALQMYEISTQLDPEFVDSYVKKSMIHSRLYFFRVDNSEERLAKSKAAVDRALELQPNHPQANLALAFYYYWGLLDYDRALMIYKSIQKTHPNISPELLGYIQRRQGKWEQSLATLEEAFKLNPRYSQLAYEIGISYMRVREYKVADTWFDRSISIDPEKYSPQLGKVGLFVILDGNTKRARAMMATLPQHYLTDYMGITLDMIDRDYQSVLDRLSSLSYDSFEEQHFYFEKNLAYASVYHALNNLALMKEHAESARFILEKAASESPEDPRYHAALGLAHAYLDHKEDAIREGRRAVDLYPVSKDAASGPSYVLHLAWIYTIVGEHEKAINQLEYLLSIPSAEFLWEHVSIPYVKLDPQWDDLHHHPGFQRLLKEYPAISETKSK